MFELTFSYYQRNMDPLNYMDPPAEVVRIWADGRVIFERSKGADE